MRKFLIIALMLMFQDLYGGVVDAATDERASRSTVANLMRLAQLSTPGPDLELGLPLSQTSAHPTSDGAGDLAPGSAEVAYMDILAMRATVVFSLKMVGGVPTLTGNDGLDALCAVAKERVFYDATFRRDAYGSFLAGAEAGHMGSRVAAGDIMYDNGNALLQETQSMDDKYGAPFRRLCGSGEEDSRSNKCFKAALEHYKAAEALPGYETASEDVKKHIRVCKILAERNLHTPRCDVTVIVGKYICAAAVGASIVWSILSVGAAVHNTHLA